MLKQNVTTFIKSLVTGMICVLADVGTSQDPVDLPLPAPDSLEEVAAAVLQEPQWDDGGVETLTRGPLHEAFAEPIVADPVPGLIVNREPPADINEMAPEFRPEVPDGDDAIWISGYWGWDERREDFIWVSGVYRIPPDGLQWVPGYWHPVSNGWQWVQGLWVEDVAETIVYLPPPPATIENGPSSPSPGADYFYIPGNWSQASQASSSGYVWNTGYWYPLQSDLIRVPAHTVWTPRGCIFVNGYLDRRLPLRGLCFAPVHIPRATYSRPGWYLRPNIVLNAQVVLHNLFVQPGYNHYLFGDYYGLPLGNRNVFPAYMYHQRRGSFDPLISFYSAYNARQGQDMMRWYGNQYAELSKNPAKRPPQKWSPIPSNTNDNAVHLNEPTRIAHSLEQIKKMEGGPRISPISANVMQDLLKLDVDRKKLAKDRVSVEGVKERAKVLGSTASVGIAPPSLALPRLDNTNRRTDSSSRVGKILEHPRNLNRDLLNPNDLSEKLKGNLNTRQGTQKDLIPQSGRIQSPEQRGLDTLRRNEQTGRLKTDAMLNRVDPIRIPEYSKPKESFKIQGGNSQPSQLNRISPSTEFRPPTNRDMGIQGNLQGEIKDKLRGQQQTQPLGQQLQQLKQLKPLGQQQLGPLPTQPNFQSNALSPNSLRQLQTEHQSRQEKQSKGDGNSDKKDHGKKPK